MVVFRQEIFGAELGARYTRAKAIGPVRPIFGFSVSDHGSLWIGAGIKWVKPFGDRGNGYFEFSSLTGLYHGSDGPDLGHLVEFRSGIAIGKKFDNGGTLSLAIDHRSNAGLSSVNPGVETIALRYSLQLK